MEEKRSYIAIDLKSFYASVECMDRKLNPLTTNLVVADKSRTEKTICLAVSPALKKYGIPGRPRLFEVVRRVNQVNSERILKAKGRKFVKNSTDENELKSSCDYRVDYIIAPPRMARYIEVSTRIYAIYLKYVSHEDMHIYSVDEVFIDATNYLATYKMTAEQLAMTMIKDVLETTGITATAGIGTNLYLAKVAMDIVAKHIEPDENGVRIAKLDEMSYRKLLWDHRPVTDFWRVGRGYAKRLEAAELYTMGDIARCSLGGDRDYYNRDLLYKMFGVNAELLIDHAWGYEPCKISDIKSYKPENNSLGAGQVLKEPYSFDRGRIVIREMADALSLELLDKGLVTDQLVLTVGYDIENLTDLNRKSAYKGDITVDRYGRQVPKPAHGTENLKAKTSSARLITRGMLNLYDRIADKNLLIRRITISATKVVSEKQAEEKQKYRQMDLFTDYSDLKKKEEEENARLDRERRLAQVMLSIKKRYGKNAILKGTSLEEGATAMERNGQIGGHKA